MTKFHDRMQKQKKTYNKAIEELEQILKDIENAELDVDELIINIKKASELVAFCKGKLHTTEKELDKIMKDLENS